MFNTFLHFAILAYQNKLGRCITNRPCTVNAVFGCNHTDCVLFMPNMFFFKEMCGKIQLKLKTNIKETIIIFCTPILFFITFVYLFGKRLNEPTSKSFPWLLHCIHRIMQ